MTHESPTQAPGSTPHDPPPLTAFAWRNGLVRPTQGRLLVGVCGALARATNTDPVLWRVIIGVLALFGGVGIVLYLIGWMLLPADGDTATPVEALLGRGASGTSATLTVILCVAALLSFGAVFATPLRPGLLGGGVVIAVALVLLLRDQRHRNRAPAAPAAPADAPVGYMSASTPATAGSQQDTSYDAPAPFAPRGPFVPVNPPPAPPVFPLPRRRPPRRPRERSRLGGLTLSVALLVLGVLYGLSQLGLPVPVEGYVAAALTVVGLGLVVGAWYGCSRGLIALGIIGSLALGGLSSSHDNFLLFAGTRTVVPATVSQLAQSYRQDVGNLVVDLSGLDLRGQDLTLDARVDVGNLTVIVGPDVDVVVDASVDLGNAQVFGQRWSGLALDHRTITDDGADGAGGGRLHLNAITSLGNLEVHR